MSSSRRFRDNPTNSNSNSNNSSTWQRSNHHPHTRRKGNPIGNWIHNRRTNRRNNNRPTNENGTRAVGTEAQAIQNMSRNAQHFHYPKEGFITPIEHSLLYAMILHPEQYPESVIRKEIEEEEFEQYLFVRDDGKMMPPSSSTERGDVGNEDGAIQQQPDERASYAQLSALLALSAEKNSSTPTQEGQTSQPQPESETRNSLTMQATSNITRSQPLHNDQQLLTVGQILCRKVLKTITKYSESHNLDRQHEISELLQPVEKRCQIRNEQAALKQLLPAYAGYTLSLVTGNPLPLLIGAASLAKEDPMVGENSNVNEMRGMGGRMGDWETAGLLDECDDD